ncbi:NUDIX hydrolase [Zooshikella harenae]|uniref:NUDIX hydrolase n=1 Tax=Zooshikella harenae TaxID=2827238 RepID=A0ABS5ZAD1_9GAMM|nr:NUDIX hydrolase [Zooshikella harenae]MBU2710935.1 NUDIX hydrolase [Zooshikella harenae]
MPSWSIIGNIQNQLLFIHRSTKTSRSHQWCFPGGGIKMGETPEQACIRETKEETGLDITICYLISSIKGHFYFKCTLKHEQQKITLKQNESDKYTWIEPARLLEIGMIMDLKKIYFVLKKDGYTIKVNEEAKKTLNLKT